MLDGGEVVEALFYEQADDPVGVENKVATLGIFAADNANEGALEGVHQPTKTGKSSREQGKELRGLWQDVDSVTVNVGRDSRCGLLAL